MALPASGPISLSQINTELIKAATSPITLNDTAVRRLAQKLTSGSTITAPTDFWGKAANFVETIKTAVSGTPNIGTGICQDNDGNIFVTGNTRNFGTALRDHFYIAKLNSNGVLQWQRGLYSNENDFSTAAIANAAGDVYVTGITNGVNSNYYDIFVVKYNASGVLQWQRRYGNADTTYGARSITIDAGGNIYIGGRVVSAPPQYQNYILFFKVDSAGNLQWARRYGNGSGDRIEGLKIVNGNLYISGLASVDEPSAFVAKVNLSGDLQWARRLDYGSAAFRLDVDASENICIAGQYSNIVGTVGLLAKFNSSGDLLWNKAFQRDGVGVYGTAVSFLSNGDIFFTSGDDQDANRVFRISSSGAFMWENTVTLTAYSSITNINDSLCFTGYYISTFYDQSGLLVLPKNNTGQGLYGGSEGILYQTPAVFTNIYDLPSTSVALTLAQQTAGTTFSAGTMVAAVPTITYEKYDI